MVLEVRPESPQLVAPAPGAATCVKVPVGDVARSILKPVSLVELSNQESEIALVEVAVAVRLLGGAGSTGATACVVALAVGLGAESPEALDALTRYHQVVEAARPVFDQDVVLAPVVATRVHGPEAADERSILKLVSFEELSDHSRLIWVWDAGAAEQLAGAAGGRSGVVALAVFDGAEVPAVLYALTR